jgi:gliding motility-associated-like protein
MRWLAVYILLLFGWSSAAQNVYFSGGDSSSVFLCREGLVYASGHNGIGQLGRGFQPHIASPDIVSGITGFGTLTNIKQLYSSASGTVIALSNGGDTVVAWGNNSNGQLGNNNQGNTNIHNNRFPYRVLGKGGVGYLTGIRHVAVGARTSYAVTNDGKALAWGSGNHGALGNGTNGPDVLLPNVVLKGPGDTLKHIVQVVAGIDYAFALLEDGTVWGWGRNHLGQLGQNTNVDSYYAIPVKNQSGSGILRNIVLLSSSSLHTLALSATDTLWAWGNNSNGQLGNNSTTESRLPVPVQNTTGNGILREVVSITAGNAFSMALLSDSTLVSWGGNAYGQLGNNTTTPSLLPAYVLNESGSARLEQVVEISSGTYFAFARRANKDILVWGDNRFGQLGLGNYTNRLLPSILTMPCLVATPPDFVSGTVSGPDKVCAVANTGTVVLTDFVGTVVAWQMSTDNFATYTSVSVRNASYIFTDLTQTTAFRAVIKHASVINYSDSWTVEVDPASQGGSLEGADTVCVAANSGSLTLSDHVGNILRWEFSTDSFATAGIPIANLTNTLAYNNLTTTTFYRAVVKNESCPEVFSNVVKIQVDALSEGGALMPSDTTVCYATNLGTVDLTGHVGAVLRWEMSVDNFATAPVVIEQTATEYMFQNLLQTTYYRTVVKNGVCAEAHSAVSIVSVDLISVGGTLASSDTVCVAANSGTLTLSGHQGAVLQWELSTDGFGLAIDTVTNTSSTYSFTDLTEKTSFRALVQNGVCAPEYSTIVLIEISALSEGGLLGGTSDVCVDANAGVLTLEQPVGEVLRWEFSTDEFQTVVQPIAHTALTYAYENLTATTQYRVVVKNEKCPQVYSSIAVIHVDALPVAGVLTASASGVCEVSNTGTLQLTGTLGTIVRWEFSHDAFVADSIELGHTEATYTFSALTQTTSYRVLVANGVCTAIYTNIVTIQVDEESEGGLLSGATTLCSGSNSGTLSLSGAKGIVTHWEASPDNFVTVLPVIPNTTTSYDYLDLSTTMYYRVVIQNGVCPPVYSTVAVLTVDMPSEGGILSSASVVCEGNNNGTLTLTTQVGDILGWEQSLDGFVADSTSITNTGITQTYSNLLQTTWYRVSVQNGVCAPVYSPMVEITVSPESQGGTVQGSTEVCATAPAGVLVLVGYEGAILRWEFSTDNFQSAGTPIAHTTDSYAYNSTTTTVYYRAQVQSPGCPEIYSSTAVIGVVPVTVPGSLNTISDVCSGNNNGTLQLSGHNGSIVRWERSVDNFATDIEPISNTSTEELFVNITVAISYRVVVQSGICPADYSTVSTIQTRPAAMGGVVSGTALVCESANSGTLALSGYQGTIVQWETSEDNFQTVTVVPNTTDVQNFADVGASTYYRVQVDNLPCPAVYSDVFYQEVSPVSLGGTIGADPVPHTGNALAEVAGYRGQIVQWETAFVPSGSWTVLDNSATERYRFEDLDTSVYLRVLVQSGVCDPVYSSVYYLRYELPVNTEIKIYPTISPNGDDINDEWIIDNIEHYPANQVRIFNRWGDMVYEEKGYDNVYKVWKGNSNVGLTVSGSRLPEGTYFYVIDRGDGKPQLSGYVVLNR